MTDLPTTMLPAGTWDCHVHVVDPTGQYPMVRDRHYTPGPASVEQLRGHMARHGIANVVIVQPSFYGDDNRCMLDALAALEGSGRGIAVLGDDVPARELARMHEAGVRGVRINLESAGVRDPGSIGGALTKWSQRIADFGWHIQLYAAPALIAAAADRLARLPVKTVIDHFGMISPRAEQNDSTLHALLTLLELGNTYVKLSAPYRLGPEPSEDVENIAKLASRLHEANPERILWGTDWPHTNREPGLRAHEVSRYRQVPATVLTQALQPWQRDPRSLHRILIENPTRLYC